MMDIPYFLKLDMRTEPKSSDTHTIQCKLNYESYYPIYTDDEKYQRYRSMLLDYGFSESNETYMDDNRIHHTFTRVDEGAWGMEKSFNSMVKAQRNRMQKSYVRTHRSDKYDILDTLVALEREGRTECLIGTDRDMVMVKVPSEHMTYSLYFAGRLSDWVSRDNILSGLYDYLSTVGDGFDSDRLLIEIVEEDY